jgi:hypothetical protein
VQSDHRPEAFFTPPTVIESRIVPAYAKVLNNLRILAYSFQFTDAVCFGSAVYDLDGAGGPQWIEKRMRSPNMQIPVGVRGADIRRRVIRLKRMCDRGQCRPILNVPKCWREIPYGDWSRP